MVGDQIVKIRKGLDLTQEEFADKLGVARFSVSQWETNKCLPDTTTIVRIAQLGGCTTDSILNPAGNPTKPRPKKKERQAGRKPGWFARLMAQ